MTQHVILTKRASYFHMLTTTLPFLADCREQVDLVFLLDASGSIQSSNFNKMKDFVAKFIEGMPIDDGVARIAVVTFSTSEKREWALNEYR